MTLSMLELIKSYRADPDRYLPMINILISFFFDVAYQATTGAFRFCILLLNRIVQSKEIPKRAKEKNFYG